LWTIVFEILAVVFERNSYHITSFYLLAKTLYKTRRSLSLLFSLSFPLLLLLFLFFFSLSSSSSLFGFW